MKLNLTVKMLITGTISYTGLVCLGLRVKDAVFVKRGQLKVLVSSRMETLETWLFFHLCHFDWLT